MDAPAPLVSIRGLTLVAATAEGEAHLLRGIDLDLPRGRITGIVGESGSGKSTLAAAIPGLYPANLSRRAGSILFGGTDLAALAPEALRAWRGTRIAAIFQDPLGALNPLFTVGTLLTDVLRRRHPGLPRREARARAGAMLTRLRVSDAAVRLRAYPHQLSGGLRQRVMIAMALLAEPELLLADEPTTALDATVEAGIVALFHELRAGFRGTILLISHDLGLVAELCDELCVLYAGTVAESGPAAAVLARPRHPYTRALIDCTVADGGTGPLATIPGEVPPATAPMTGCLFAGRCAFAAPVCLDGPPPLVPVGEGRRAACKRSFEVLA